MTMIDLFSGRRPRRQWRVGLALLLAAGLASTQAQAQAPVLDRAARLQAAEACAAKTSRLGRLECYDELFRERTPAEPARTRSPLWQAVAEHEARRDAEAFGVRVSQTADTVLMSAPALGTLPPRPLLVVSCDDAITRFQLHLSEPLAASRAPLELHGEGVSLTQTWRVLDDGHVVSGGRGLPAIGTLKRLLRGEQLRLASEQPALDGLRFELDGWRAAIEPLRAMCRW